MTQEEKDLLLKDLCSRLPYGVKVQYECWDEETEEYIDVIDVLYSINVDKWISVLRTDEEVYIEGIKPYLFPLSSMTEEQKKELAEINPEFYSLICWDGDIYISSMNVHGYNWLNKNHFDWRGLIPKGLANDATDKNIY